jgi:hypothetical protein
MARPDRFPIVCLAFAALAAIPGCNSVESQCNIRPSVKAKDTTVATADTVRIRAESRDPCGETLVFLWSFDGGATQDTTETGTLERVFGAEDQGTRNLRIQAMNSHGKVSGPVEITLSIVDKEAANRP